MARFNNIRARRGPVSFRRARPMSATSQVESLARQLANQIIRERDAAKRRQRLGRIYTRFDATDDILPNNVEIVTRGLFANNTGSLVSMFTSSNLTATQKTYFQEEMAAVFVAILLATVQSGVLQRKKGKGKIAKELDGFGKRPYLYLSIV